MESWTHLKTVKITMNIFAVYIGMYKSTGYLKSIYEMIINGLVFSCARGWTKRKITPGGVYKIITERIKEIKKKCPMIDFGPVPNNNFVWCRLLLKSAPKLAPKGKDQGTFNKVLQWALFREQNLIFVFVSSMEIFCTSCN